MLCAHASLATKLVSAAVQRMKERGAEEVVLETEVTNKSALRLYENRGFVREKRLYRFYLNGTYTDTHAQAMMRSA